MSSIENNQAEHNQIDDLRAILLAADRQRLDDLQTVVHDLKHSASDNDALIKSLTPVMGDIIRASIKNNRDEMIEVLYPIIGQLVVRAVTEAISALARRVDEQMRSSLNPEFIWYQLRLNTVGVSTGEATLRRALPFVVNETFLIHRDSGLLLWHANQALDAADDDSDIISGMLTAIRDFAKETIGKDRDGQLDEIRYGNNHILLESAQYLYAAVVYEGIEPEGFRQLLRSQLININDANLRILRQYEGDATHFAVGGSELAAAVTQFTLSRDDDGLHDARRATGAVRLSKASWVGYTLLLFLVVTVCIRVIWLWLLPYIGK